jgi:hypothetical protein
MKSSAPGDDVQEILCNAATSPRAAALHSDASPRPRQYRQSGPVFAETPGERRLEQNRASEA